MANICLLALILSRYIKALHIPLHFSIPMHYGIENVNILGGAIDIRHDNSMRVCRIDVARKLQGRGFVRSCLFSEWVN